MSLRSEAGSGTHDLCRDILVDADTAVEERDSVAQGAVGDHRDQQGGLIAQRDALQFGDPQQSG